MSVRTATRLGVLIDAATLANARFRTCHCRDDCPHDAETLNTARAVRAYLECEIGLSPTQIDELGAML